MKRPTLTSMWAAGALFIFSGLAPARAQDLPRTTAPRAFDWQEYGQKVLKEAPAGVQQGTDLDRARFMMTKVGDELARQGTRANTSWVDRQILLRNEDGTCGDVSGKLQAALRGAGIDSVELFGEKSKETASVVWRTISDPFDQNADHGAVAASIGGQAYVFDLWVHAVTHEKSFTSAEKSLWNGLPADQWEQVMKKAGYVAFSTLTKNNGGGATMHGTTASALRRFVALESAPLVQLSESTRIDPGGHWEGVVPTSEKLDLNARISYSKPAGAAYVMEVELNDTSVPDSLLNKRQSFTMKDGRTLAYLSGHAWLVFSSPDFAANNTTAGGGYQVMTSPGQAYHYQWNIAEFTDGLSRMKVVIRNTGSMPLVVGSVKR